MTDNKTADNISENYAQNSALDRAEEMLRKQFALDTPSSGDFGAEWGRRAEAFSTLNALIQKERSAPIGTGLERLTELSKGIYSGYIVLTVVNLSKNRLHLEFFHTIHKEIVGSITLERKSGYFSIQHIELSAF